MSVMTGRWSLVVRGAGVKEQAKLAVGLERPMPGVEVVRGPRCVEKCRPRSLAVLSP